MNRKDSSCRLTEVSGFLDFGFSISSTTDSPKNVIQMFNTSHFHSILESAYSFYSFIFFPRNKPTGTTPTVYSNFFHNAHYLLLLSDAELYRKYWKLTGNISRSWDKPSITNWINKRKLGKCSEVRVHLNLFSFRGRTKTAYVDILS